MGKYRAANSSGFVELKYQPQQFAFLGALRDRFCPRCATTWQMAFGDLATLRCPKCSTVGIRTYNRLLLLAGRQSGKTRVGTLAGVLEASMPGSYGWVTAPTYRDLTDFVEPAFFAQLPQDWLDEGDWNVSDRLLTLPSDPPARVAFRSLEDPEAMRGPTLDWYLMDEACKVSGRAQEVGNATLAIKQGVAIFTTTPKGEDWVYEDILCRAKEGEPGYWAAIWKSIENPVMDQAYVEAQRRQMSPEMFRQEYEASVETFQGAIYSAEQINRCTIDDESPEGLAELKALLPEWPRITASREAMVGLDPGSDHPFAGTFGVMTPGALVIFDEYLEREKPAMLHAQELRRKAGALSPRWGVDRSQPQTILELAQHGIFAESVEAGPGSVVAGIERVKSWMLSGRLKFVKSRTVKLRSQLKSYRWAETEKKDGSSGRQEPYKRKDDLCDALSYQLRMWPQLPEQMTPATGRDLSRLDDKSRAEIERMLRHEQAKDEKVADGVGEFFGTSEPEYVSSAMDGFWG